MAVFDVGPGGAPGESWRIFEMDMFDDPPALTFFRLAGGAILAVPNPQGLGARRLASEWLVEPLRQPGGQ